jgi:hypothetical protein
MHMKKDSRYMYYLIDTLVFLLINAVILTKVNINLQAMFASLQWTTIILLALGVYRLTDIITQESVTEFIRAPFMDRTVDGNKETWEISEHGIRGFFGILFSCNACMGVWVSMIVFYFFVFFPAETLVFMVIMALTGFERFFSKIYNFLEKRG